MDRTERLLDLVALLLDSREPISWAEIREAFPDDYGSGSIEAAERKFERDKADLLELGIPITFRTGDDDLKDGYVVNRDAYYLPEADLSPEELAVLYAAGSAALTSEAFPGRDDLAHALRKIGFFAEPGVAATQVRMELGTAPQPGVVAAHLEQLWAAAAARKWVQLAYYSPRSGNVSDRKVDPYGLALRRGTWSLVGFCHLRQGIRTFHVHRIRDLKVNPSKPRSADFQVPADFKLDDHVANYPWQHRFHEPIVATLALKGELARLAARLFPGAQVESAGDEARVKVRASFLEGLARYALSLGAECRVLEPPDAVEQWRQMASRVLARHQPQASGGMP